MLEVKFSLQYKEPNSPSMGTLCPMTETLAEAKVYRSCLIHPVQSERGHS